MFVLFILKTFLLPTAVSGYNYPNRAENAVKLSVKGTSLLMVLETGYELFQLECKINVQ